MGEVVRLISGKEDFNNFSNREDSKYIILRKQLGNLFKLSSDDGLLVVYIRKDLVKR